MQRLKPLSLILEDARPIADVAILSEEAINHYRGIAAQVMTGEEIGNHGYPGDSGSARMLLQEHQTFAVIDTDTDFSSYQLLILPDSIILDTFLMKKIHNYMKQGGMVIGSAFSGMDQSRKNFMLDGGLSATGELNEFAPNYMQVNSDSFSWDKDILESPVVMYTKVCLVKPKTSDIKIVSRILNPYFQRSWKHFCSHQHTPYQYNSSIQDSYGAVFAGSNWVYFAHPIFSEFYNTGQPLLKFLFRGAVNHLIPNRRIKTNLPSTARVFINEQATKGRILIHHSICEHPETRQH